MCELGHYVPETKRASGGKLGHSAVNRHPDTTNIHLHEPQLPTDVGSGPAGLLSRSPRRRADSVLGVVRGTAPRRQRPGHDRDKLGARRTSTEHRVADGVRVRCAGGRCGMRAVGGQQGEPARALLCARRPGPCSVPGAPGHPPSPCRGRSPGPRNERGQPELLRV